MEHIVQFGINIDDEAIRRTVIANAQHEIIDKIKDDIGRQLFGRYPAYAPGLSDFCKGIIMEVIEGHKDEIIQQAASELASRLAKTKRAKEMLESVCNDTKAAKDEGLQN